jgi:hypothetical protein
MDPLLKGDNAHYSAFHCAPKALYEYEFVTFAAKFWKVGNTGISNGGKRGIEVTFSRVSLNLAAKVACSRNVSWPEVSTPPENFCHPLVELSD